VLNLIIGIVLGALFSPLWMKIGSSLSSLINILWLKLINKLNK